VAGVVVTTDAPTYAPGDAISATVQNNTAGPIAPPGGIVCQGSPWPFSVQLLDDSGNWQDVVYPRTPPCVGIAVRQVGPGESQTRTLNAPSDVGQYRLVYAYTASDGTQGAATSDPFTIAAP
jgi:hypothetical protein